MQISGDSCCLRVISGSLRTELQLMGSSIAVAPWEDILDVMVKLPGFLSHWE